MGLLDHANKVSSEEPVFRHETITLDLFREIVLAILIHFFWGGELGEKSG